VPSAPARTVASLEELRAAAGAIGFPLVVRPLSSEAPIAGRKALIVHDPERLHSALVSWPAGHQRLIVQRFVRGPRYNVDFAAQRGRPIRMVATRILATNSHDGTGIDVHGRTEPLPDDLRLYTERMVARLGYHGVGLIQFMVDRERGEVSFLELNPRFNGNTAVPEAHGLDLVRLAVDLAADPDRSEPVLISPGGLTHAWTFGAMRGIAVSLRTGAMRRREVPAALWAGLRAALTADYHVMFRWSDPWPGLMQLLRLAGPFGRRLTRWRTARLGPPPVAGASLPGPSAAPGGGPEAAR
jgi:biotin carboxylase